MAAASCVANAAAKRVVTARRSDDPRNTANNAGKSQFLLRAAYMMMASLHWPDSCQDRWALYIGTHNSADSCKRWPVRAEPPQVCPGSDRIPALPKGGALFVCLNSSLPRRLARCPLRQFPVCNAQGSRCISHPTHFIGGLVHVHITFVL